MEHLQETLDFSRELNTDFVQFARVLPMEGTPLYEKMGIRPTDEFKENGTQHGTMKYESLLLTQKESIHS